MVMQQEIRRLRTFLMRCLQDILAWAHPVGQAKKCKCVEAGRGCACEITAEAKATAMAGPCAADA